MEHSSNDALRAYKASATALQAEAKAQGNTLSRGHALEQASRECGFRDWNSARAAAEVAMVNPPPEILTWRNLDRPLPRLPFRIHMVDSLVCRSIGDLMRWAEGLETIAEVATDENRSQLLTLLGRPVPYVFVQDSSRWSDRRFYLCDRGYEEISGIAFSEDELTRLKVQEWGAEYGAHSGQMMTVFSDDMRMDGSSEELRMLARLLASIAVMADHLHSQVEVPRRRKAAS